MDRYRSDELLEAVQGLNSIAEQAGLSMAQMALAWALRDPRVTSVLLGASSTRQLDENLAALERLSFTDAELAVVDEHAVDAGINLWASRSSDL